MTRIDRYLLFLYARVLTICFLSIYGMLIVVLVFTNLDEFQRFAEQTHDSLILVLCNYYGPYLLTMFERLSGLLALLALLFVIAWLNKTNELTALLAAGVTRRRIIRPLMIASMVVIGTAATLREFVIPHYQDRLDRNPQDLTGDLPRPMRPTFDRDVLGLFQGKHLLPANMEIVSPNLKIQGNTLPGYGNKILAESAFFRSADSDHPAGYLFKGVSSPKNINELRSVFREDGSPLLLTSHDTEWIEPGTCFLVSKIEYELLRGGSAWKQFASTMELVRHLKGENTLSGDDLRVQIHQRMLRPVIDWTVLLLGIPVLLARPDRHMFWVAGACLFVVGGFTAVVMLMGAVGATGTILSPALAAWLPLVVFLPWAWAKSSHAMDS